MKCSRSGVDESLPALILFIPLLCVESGLLEAPDDRFVLVSYLRSERKAHPCEGFDLDIHVTAE